jgi:hypothetical protein
MSTEPLNPIAGVSALELFPAGDLLATTSTTAGDPIGLTAESFGQVRISVTR